MKTTLNKEEILASSSGWVAALLNFIPGIGAGYLYQRRWLPYFLTSASVIFWFSLRIILQSDIDPTQAEQIIGISGLLFISLVTVIESYVAYKKALKSVREDTKEKIYSKKSNGWFRN